jgi:divalent metal cation (Fe/Co/Zn/Cd) transporter
VLYRRLTLEAAGGDTCRIEASEARAGKIAGTLLYLLVAYVVAAAGYQLLHRGTADDSPLGIAIALVAAFGMPVLARAKLRIADQIGSRALRADAMETFTCGYMSWVLLAGLAANALLHWWWLDGVAALVLVPLLLREAREAFAGECDCPPEQ